MGIIEAIHPSIWVGLMGLIIMGVVILNDQHQKRKKARVRVSRQKGYPWG